MKEKELALISHLLTVDGIGTKTILALTEKFGTAENILNAGFAELIKVYGLNETLAKRILNSKKDIEKSVAKFEKDFETLGKSGGTIISYWDEKYPELLKNIGFPPLLLYIKGNVDLLSSQGIAIVGTRKASHYGIKQAEFFAEELSKNKLTIVSGLARGIDTYAHKSTLKNNGNTIAVLGNGLDYVYPPENKNLYKEIAEKGLLVSEYPLGTLPDAVNFPRRNRIISGLTLGTLVIETKLTGGSLLTASYALEQGREVFAVPGNITSPQSEGTNRLIQKGEAKLVTNVDDILSELKISFENTFSESELPRKDIALLDVFEQKIYEILSDKPQHLEAIAEKTNFSIPETSVYLLNLELKGFVEQLPGKYFVIT